MADLAEMILEDGKAEVVCNFCRARHDFTAAELPEIPSRDLPMGLQSWMRNTDFWASMSATPGTERANISIEVP